ncbi:related to methyltransferase [Phialocephala subalpina]|uniref:Related to methyltransferase n=1 Tax=Phialocephala subalpina TaxID=576137 RepID=A0A1L7XJ95_9HELO|nr:related to methyltransferase [Phialocephala subalpina]
MAEQVQPEPVDDSNENDSAFGDNDQGSTASIGSSILKYRQENGRTYHAYKDGSKGIFPNRRLISNSNAEYVLPNDEGENDRLDLQHHMYSLMLDGKLTTAPIPKDQQLHRVLDAGTGTGIWAIDFADEHPESQVLGVDLSPIQPQFIPPNCTFEVDDIEEDWTYKHKFDLIFMRMMTGSLSDWPRCFKQCYDNLNPGGWIEIHDMKFPIEDNGNSFPPDCAVKQWTDHVITAAKNLGRPLDSAKHYKQQLIDVEVVGDS